MSCPRPPGMMRKQIILAPGCDRRVRLAGETFTLPAGTLLDGELTLTASQGPGAPPHPGHPSFVHSCFLFDLAGKRARQDRFLTWFHFKPPDEARLIHHDPEFVSECGILSGLVREGPGPHCGRPDVFRQTNEGGFTTYLYELMLSRYAVRVRCLNYKECPGIAMPQTVSYSRALDDLLLHPGMTFRCDGTGRVLDWFCDEPPYLTLFEAGAASESPRRRAGLEISQEPENQG